MAKKIIVLLLSLCILLSFVSCPSGIRIWSDKVYTGSITKDDPEGSTGYIYDTYYIAVGGKWKFKLESDDGIYIFLEVRYPFTGADYYEKGTETSLTTTIEITYGADVFVHLYKYNSEWEANGYEADYTLTATRQW